MRALRLALAPLLLAALFAGCFEDSFDAASARSAPRDLPAEAGRGDHTLTVVITEGPGGPALADAAVAVSWRDGTALTMRTDAQGVATARVPAEKSVYVSVYLDGFTEETIDAHPSGAAGATSRLAVPLYRASLSYVVNGTLGPGDLSGHRLGVGEFHWTPQEVQWGDTPEARAGYLERLVELHVRLVWMNGPAGGGDLGIGAGASGDDPQVIADAGENQALPGEHEETLHLGFPQVYDLGWREASTLHLGAGTGSGYVAPIGLGYTLEVTARFEGDVDRPRPVPAPGFALLAGVAALAVLARPRRPGS
jgi:hypothetical protein